MDDLDGGQRATVRPRRRITLVDGPAEPRLGSHPRRLQVWAWRLLRPRCGYCARVDRVAGRRLHNECDGSLLLPAGSLDLFDRDLSAWPGHTVREILLSRFDRGRIRELPCWCGCRPDLTVLRAHVSSWARQPPGMQGPLRGIQVH